MILVNCSKSKIRIFANDTPVYFTCSNKAEFEELVKVIMTQLDEWFTANLLTLNTDKSYFSIFRTTQNQITNLPEVMINP